MPDAAVIPVAMNSDGGITGVVVVVVVAVALVAAVRDCLCLFV